MAAGLPLEAEDDARMADVLARVERWRLAELALAEARQPEALTTGTAHPVFGVAAAVAAAAWVQAFGVVDGAAGTALTFGAVAALFFAWWVPRWRAHRLALAAAEAEHVFARAAVDFAVRELFAAPFEVTRGSLRYRFTPA
jgi:Flp pilus assembly protein TadB